MNPATMVSSFTNSCTWNSIGSLGIPRFSELYVRGFLSGGSYQAIPLEVNAYTLEGRFEANPAQRFSVADEVTKWQAGGRL